ncbi:hypothetical protein CRYUN_Cryun15aG0154100 [Craigia yunnanensis]
MGDGEILEQRRSLAAPLIFFVVIVFQFATKRLQDLKKGASKTDKEIQLREEIKLLLKEAASFSQPFAFAQAAKLRRSAAAKEKELANCQAQRTKEVKLSYDLYLKVLFILKVITYVVIIFWFWRSPIASVSQQLVQPFGKVLSWKTGGSLNNNVMPPSPLPPQNPSTSIPIPSVVPTSPLYLYLSLTDFPFFLTSHSSPSPSPRSNGHHDFTVFDFATRPLYSSLKISSFSPHLLHQHSRKFNIDVAGPRVFFCADKSIDLMLKFGACQYMEFKSIDATFLGDDKGNLWSAPDSRASIFKDKSLGLMEKNQLMRFFKLVQGHLAGEQGIKISEEDLQSPFVGFLNKMGLPPKIKLSVSHNLSFYFPISSCLDAQLHLNLFLAFAGLYCMQQQWWIMIKKMLEYVEIWSRQKMGSIDWLCIMHPLAGELSQAFCRHAAVKGCLYDNGCYKGVRLASGQDIFSKKLILDPSFMVPFPLGLSPPHPLQEKLPLFSLRDDRGKVARGICIIKASLKPDISNFLVVYPPISLVPEQVTSIRLLQIGSNLAVCPQDINPKLKSIPTLANDLQMIFQRVCGTEDRGPSRESSKETCTRDGDNHCQSKRSLLVLDQDLNCLPTSVATSELLKSQQTEQSATGPFRASSFLKLRKNCRCCSEKEKKSRLKDVARIALEDLAKYFDLPIVEAFKNLNVGLTVLKRKCREFGIPRWPHRKIKSLDGLIRDLQEEAEQQQREDEAAAFAVAKRRMMLETKKKDREREREREREKEKVPAPMRRRSSKTSRNVGKKI